MDSPTKIEEQEGYLMEMEHRTKEINDMKAVLDFLEANPAIPIPYFGVLNAFGEAKDLDTIARALSPCNKSSDGGFYSLSRKFGDKVLSVNFAHEAVCEAIVVGTEEVPEQITRAYTKEIVEWKCPDGVLRPS